MADLPEQDPARTGETHPGETNPGGTNPVDAHPNVRAVVDAARSAGLTIQPRTFPEGTATAADAAAAIGCDLAQIVKSLIFEAVTEAHAAQPDRPNLILALVSGSNQLDEKKLARAAGARKTRRVDADTVKAATGFPIGGVPPFGHTTPLTTFVDADLSSWPEVWAAAGTPHTVFALSPTQLVESTRGTVAELRRVGTA